MSIKPILTRSWAPTAGTHRRVKNTTNQYFTYASRKSEIVEKGQECPLGLGAKSEADDRSFIIGLLVQRETKLDTQRTKRGHPSRSETDRSSKVSDTELIRSTERIPHIEESHAAEPELLHDWKHQFGAQYHR